MNKDLRNLLDLTTKRVFTHHRFTQEDEYRILVEKINLELTENVILRDQLLSMKSSIVERCPICNMEWSKK